MCGILGVVGRTAVEIEPSKIDAMLAALLHRGPDDQGVATFGDCILGQTRLSILDIKGGHQPMLDNGRNITITFNGEIYNYRDLQIELEKAGHSFSTKSDTEVILKAYIEYGDACPNHLEGMFSFAIWDEERKVLFCARDRFGEKPFYYARTKRGDYIFASEIKALLASGEVLGEINMEAISMYLGLSYIPPSMTVYKNMFVLPPASSLTLKGGVIEVKKYWELKKTKPEMSYAAAKTELKKYLKKAVEKMMVADVEVGTLLSGGVDSTLVSYFAQQSTATPIKTFSVGYEEYINELPFAAEAAKKFGTEHYPMQVKGEMVTDLIEVSRRLDEPHGDPSNFPQYLVSKLAGSKVKVALTGDGADELFMGYGWYWKHRNLSWRTDFVQKLFPHPFEDFIKNVQIFTEKERLNLLKTNPEVKNFIPENMQHAALGDVEKINFFDLTFYLPGKLLSKVDRTAMMNSLETRCPFLDRELVEFVYSLPDEFKTDGKSGKRILKDILVEIMPSQFVYRRKQGFGAPIREWLKTKALQSLVRDTFAHNPALYNCIKESEVEKVVDAFYKKGKRGSDYKLWTLLCLGLWFQFHA